MWELIQQVKAATPDANPLGKTITKIVLPESKFTNLEGVVLGAIGWLSLLAGGLAVIAIVYSGIMYMTAGGDTAKAEKAKNNLVWAIIGVVIITLTYVIIQWVQNILSGTI